LIELDVQRNSGQTMDFTNGGKVRAADILGVSLKTLYNRLHRYQGCASGLKFLPHIAECTATGMARSRSLDSICVHILTWDLAICVNRKA